MIPCYFCQEPRHAETACRCKPCAEKYDVASVNTYYLNAPTKDPKDLILDYTKIIFTLNSKYHEIVADFRTMQTTVEVQSAPGQWDMALILPGHPLTLDNFRAKLPIYLTFS